MPPQEAIAALCAGAQQSASHVYQSYVGIPELRNAFARWYEDWYGVSLDPDTEIQPLFGSKEGIMLISLAFLDEGDRVLVPDPGYPAYSSASRLAGGVPVSYDLVEEHGWQPDFDALEVHGPFGSEADVDELAEHANRSSCVGRTVCPLG